MRHLTFILSSILLSTFVSLFSYDASAATRNVCFRLRIEDDRFACATTSDTGNRRGCNPGGHSDFVGARFELWDKDSGSGDEFIGLYRISGTGTRCAVFEWENASYSKGETNPDVYVKMRSYIGRTSGGPYVQAVDFDGDKYPSTTWRNGTSSDDDAYVSRNCKSGETCNIGTIYPTDDSASDRGQYVQMLDSAQHVLQIYGSDMDSGTIDAWYPGTDQLPSCPTGTAFSRSDFCLPSSLGSDGDRVTHEMGHILQMQMFNQDVLRDALIGGQWQWDTTESESAATTEGWASYVGTVAWYNPQASGVDPRFSGWDVEEVDTLTTQCTGNRTFPGQGAKAFWDYDDDNNEDGAVSTSQWDDRNDKPTTWMARQWDEFSNGTGNRDDFESGMDGVNLRDYLHYSCNGCSASTETLIEHNCMQGQSND
ncbi:MAG: hypothetical protein V3V08_02630 [Nannocystaceae bacterium]